MVRLGGAAFALVLLLCATTACSSRNGDPNSSDDAPNGGPAVLEEDSEHDQLLRSAKDKREQCDALADAIEGTQQGDVIININDRSTLERLAKKLEANADRLRSVDLTVSELVDFRDEYVEAVRNGADALNATASASSGAKQRSGIVAYQKSDASVDGVIQQINAYCNSPFRASD